MDRRGGRVGAVRDRDRRRPRADRPGSPRRGGAGRDLGGPFTARGVDHVGAAMLRGDARRRKASAAYSSNSVSRLGLHPSAVKSKDNGDSFSMAGALDTRFRGLEQAFGGSAARSRRDREARRWGNIHCQPPFLAEPNRRSVADGTAPVRPRGRRRRRTVVRATLPGHAAAGLDLDLRALGRLGAEAVLRAPRRRRDSPPPRAGTSSAARPEGPRPRAARRAPRRLAARQRDPHLPLGVPAGERLGGLARLPLVLGADRPPSREAARRTPSILLHRVPAPRETFAALLSEESGRG